MWFWFSVIALLFWSGSDLFSKIGCRDADDKYAHLKMVMAVGVVMGLHAAYEIFIGGTEINFSIILTYLPVSLLYILSMALVCVGVIGLGIVEAREDDELRLARQEAGNYKYAKSVLALVLPILYCVLDALGTFADSKVLETLNEDSANCAYELTFLAAGIACFVYVVLIRRQKLVPKREGPKYLGALCETAGQFAYIYALADTEHVALAGPIISAYCVLSVVWSRIFLKEKLSWKHYLMIALVVAGIVILGIYDE